MSKLQRHERCAHYHLPFHCGFCGQCVVNADGEDHQINPCKHTLFIAHDEGYEYLADRAVAQLREKGYIVSIEKGGFIEVSPSSEDDECSSPDFITDNLQFPDGLKVAAYAGPPAGFGTYVGFAPLEGE